VLAGTADDSCEFPCRTGARADDGRVVAQDDKQQRAGQAHRPPALIDQQRYRLTAHSLIAAELGWRDWRSGLSALLSFVRNSLTSWRIRGPLCCDEQTPEDPGWRSTRQHVDGVLTRHGDPIYETGDHPT